MPSMLYHVDRLMNHRIFQMSPKASYTRPPLSATYWNNILFVNQSKCGTVGSKRPISPGPLGCQGTEKNNSDAVLSAYISMPAEFYTQKNC